MEQLSGQTLLSRYTLRAPVPGDFPAVADLVVANELAGAGRSTLGADFVSSEWSLPGFHLGTDACLVVGKTGAVAGYAQAVFEAPNVVDSWGVVHPAHRGRGLGTALFAWIEQRARELLDAVDSPVFRHKASAGDHGAGAILRSRGLRPVRHFWHMEIDLADGGGAARDGRPRIGIGSGIGLGIGVAGIDPEKDLPTVHAMIDEALTGHWGERSTGFEPWIEEQRGEPGYDPSLWLLATSDGEPVGALTMTRAAAGAWIEYLGVLAAYRRRGIAAALLERAFALCAERGLPRVLVSVDSDNATGASGAYERAGMRLVAGWNVWERPFE